MYFLFSILAHLKIVHKNDVEISTEANFLNGKSDKLQHENEILINLVKQFGLTKSVKSPDIRNSLWIQIAEEFNRINGCNWELKKLKNRWKNYKLSQDDADINDEQKHFKVESDSKSFIQSPRIVSDKIQHENEIIINLTKKFGLTKDVTIPEIRNSLWIEILEEFNRINNCNWELRKLKNRWKNFKLNEINFDDVDEKGTITLEDNSSGEMAPKPVAVDDFVIQAHQTHQYITGTGNYLFFIGFDAEINNSYVDI